MRGKYQRTYIHIYVRATHLLKPPSRTRSTPWTPLAAALLVLLISDSHRECKGLWRPSTGVPVAYHCPWRVYGTLSLRSSDNIDGLHAKDKLLWPRTRVPVPYRGWVRPACPWRLWRPSTGLPVAYHCPWRVYGTISLR